MKRTLLTLLLCFVVTGFVAIASWIARGMYDEMFMMEGWFHVVNTSENDLAIEIRFPSDKTVAFSLKAYGFINFIEKDTGEGALCFTINGKSIDHVGYVTTLNSIVVLAVNEENVSFTQIFPTLKPESIGRGNE